MGMKSKEQLLNELQDTFGEQQAPHKELPQDRGYADYTPEQKQNQIDMANKYAALNNQWQQTGKFPEQQQMIAAKPMPSPDLSQRIKLTPPSDQPLFTGIKKSLKPNSEMEQTARDMANRDKFLIQPPNNAAGMLPSPYMKPKVEASPGPALNNNPPLDDEDLKALGLMPK